ncbi:hypothetical protein RND81_03G044400 [Saponaria officinalis]|uniref:glucan endo-1,3-beta-D-glucosidase n=1 Tax=Saponaria officinalis TaxID=3572 RepID=A0AAW1M5E9_SAPOF
MIFRAARLALIAEEVNCSDVIPVILKFLRDTINPWLNNKFVGNGFVYEMNWGGLVSKQSVTDQNADFGFGLFDHVHYLGHFVYGIAVLAKLDHDWGIKFRRQAYALVGSWISLGRTAKSIYTRLRCFDLYKLHTWKGSAIEECNSHHSSEHVFLYYTASLLGLAYGDDHLMGIGSTLASFEIEATKTWFHVREGEVYGEEFSKENKLVGISRPSKRETKLFYASAEQRDIRVGMNVLPLLPITEILFSDVSFVKEVVEWATPSLMRKDAEDAWIGFVYALEALYDKASPLKKIRSLKSFNEGHSLTSFLWWVHSRGERVNFWTWCRKADDECWFCANCG